jgi:hypothetical protein
MEGRNSPPLITTENLTWTCKELGFRAYGEKNWNFVTLYAHRPWWIPRSKLGKPVAYITIANAFDVRMSIKDDSIEPRLKEVAHFLESLYMLTVTWR